MCIVTTEELEAEKQFRLRVTQTNIFARHTRPGHQVLAYSLSIASNSAAAMILPLPVSRPSGEDALCFIDLSGYPEFFEDLDRACTCEVIDDGMFDFDDLAGAAAPASVLAVHQVGDFEASYVPSMADFTRLDPRFRLPEEVWKSMPDYSDYGFAVFQLKLTLTQNDAEVANDIHPMAFEFPTRDTERLFFPTVHVHDGAFHDSAGFYHRFYCQRENARAEFKYQMDLLECREPTPTGEIDEKARFYGYPWYSLSMRLADDAMPIERCEGLVDPHHLLHSMSLIGDYPNRDIWLGDTADE